MIIIIIITGKSRILRMLFVGNILKNRTAKCKSLPNFTVFKLINNNNSYKNSLYIMKTINTLHNLNIETVARQHNSF